MLGTGIFSYSQTAFYPNKDSFAHFYHIHCLHMLLAFTSLTYVGEVTTVFVMNLHLLSVGFFSSKFPNSDFINF